MKDNNIIRAARRLESVQEYYFSKKLREIAEMRKQGVNVLNLGIGSPDLPPAPGVMEVMSEKCFQENMHAYQSYNGIPELRSAFANWYRDFFGVALNPDSEILPLLGSKEGIMHIAMTFLEQGDIALIPNPGYPTYKAASELAGAQVLEYTLSEENDWLPDIKQLESFDLQRVKILWLNYPHMPTGARANKTAFSELVALARKHNILLVNDNPYSFILNEQHLSLLSVPDSKGVVLELNSLSKSHNMAGWRIGMLAGDAGLLKLVLRFKSNMDSGMFKPAQLAAAQALQVKEDWFENLNKTYLKRRVIVHQILDALGCAWDKDSVGLFVWSKVPDSFRDGYQLSDKVLEGAHVFITPGGVFGSQGSAYLRASLCNDEATLKEALTRVLRYKSVIHNGHTGLNGYAKKVEIEISAKTEPVKTR